MSSFSLQTFHHPNFNKLKKDNMTSHPLKTLKSISPRRVASGIFEAMVLIPKNNRFQPGARSKVFCLSPV